MKLTPTESSVLVQCVTCDVNDSRYSLSHQICCHFLTRVTITAGLLNELEDPTLSILNKDKTAITTMSKNYYHEQVDVLLSKNQALCCKLNLLIYCH